MKSFSKSELREFLEERVHLYNRPRFIETDPIQIPHRFTLKEDIEISGFLTALISWGNRTTIIRSAERMMTLMGGTPYDFVMSHSERDLRVAEEFVHRTFNGTDLITFIVGLRHIYREWGGPETLFALHRSPDSLQPAIHNFRKILFSLPHLDRSRKHLPDPLAGSAAKRINMFLRWMVRSDSAGVDFGLWKSISPSLLSCPLDVHSGNVARRLGLISRRQNDARAVAELDNRLRDFDRLDPVKYDYALFGLGVFERFGAGCR